MLIYLKLIALCQKLSVGIIIILFTSLSCFSQAPDFLWAVKGGGAGIYSDGGYAIAADPFGNTYITGSFSGESYFGDILLYGDGISAFAAKIDPSGSFLWANVIESTVSVSGTGIGIDSSGNIFITGYFDDNAQIGDFYLSSSGSSDVYVAKLSASGEYIWAQRAGGSGIDIATGISIDQNGNAVITGRYTGSPDFGDTHLESSGDFDIFVSKIAPDGNFVWAISAGGKGGSPG